MPGLVGKQYEARVQTGRVIATYPSCTTTFPYLTFLDFSPRVRGGILDGVVWEVSKESVRRKPTDDLVGLWTC